jgi:hypothetical protein
MHGKQKTKTKIEYNEFVLIGGWVRSMTAYDVFGTRKLANCIRDIRQIVTIFTKIRYTRSGIEILLKTKIWEYLLTANCYLDCEVWYIQGQREEWGGIGRVRRDEM